MVFLKGVIHNCKKTNVRTKYIFTSIKEIVIELYKVFNQYQNSNTTSNSNVVIDVDYKIIN